MPAARQSRAWRKLLGSCIRIPVCRSAGGRGSARRLSPGKAPADCLTGSRSPGQNASSALHRADPRVRTSRRSPPRRCWPRFGLPDRPGPQLRPDGSVIPFALHIVRLWLADGWNLRHSVSMLKSGSGKTRAREACCLPRSVSTAIFAASRRVLSSHPCGEPMSYPHANRSGPSGTTSACFDPTISSPQSGQTSMQKANQEVTQRSEHEAGVAMRGAR